jgi:hypothetical protein
MHRTSAAFNSILLRRWIDLQVVMKSLQKGAQFAVAEWLVKLAGRCVATRECLRFEAAASGHLPMLEGRAEVNGCVPYLFA